jgi:UDP-N-acetylglucosamine:LPS N-acetylglucosamine transferase
VLVTKGGPATIMEAIHVGIPLILTGYVPPQERANVRYVLDNGIGVWMDEGRSKHFDRLAETLVHTGGHRGAANPLAALPAKTAAQEIDELVCHRDGEPPR